MVTCGAALAATAFLAGAAGFLTAGAALTGAVAFLTTATAFAGAGAFFAVMAAFAGARAFLPGAVGFLVGGISISFGKFPGRKPVGSVRFEQRRRYVISAIRCHFFPYHLPHPII